MKNNIKLPITLIAILLLRFNESNAQNTFINGSMFVYGEMGVFGNLETSTDAQLFFHNGSTLHMLGTNTTIHPGTEVFANNTTTQIGTGRILFVGAAAQTLDGGNSSTIGGTQPSLINAAVNNANNLTLINSNTRLSSGIDFIAGHVIIGNNNLELSDAATATNANSTKHVVTNGTGFMTKENFTTAFSFPVGRAISDFTPAMITPTVADNFFVQVKNYTESGSEESETIDGVDRTWTIFSTSGSGANISLQHNSTSNGSNFDPNDAFVTQYQGVQWIPSASQNQGVWQSGSGANAASAVGSISGSTIRDRSYASTVTNELNPLAFFSKSSNILNPLPITLLDFRAAKIDESKSLLTWSTASEINSDYFDVETSTNGNDWTKIGKVKAKGNTTQLSDYQLVHNNPALGLNYYRLNLFDLAGHSEYSPIRELEFESNAANFNNILIYPNPASDVINIRTMNQFYTYTLINMEGKIIATFNNNNHNSDFTIDLSQYSNGVYQLIASNISNDVKVFKIVLNK